MVQSIWVFWPPEAEVVNSTVDRKRREQFSLQFSSQSISEDTCKKFPKSTKELAGPALKYRIFPQNVFLDFCEKSKKLTNFISMAQYFCYDPDLGSSAFWTGFRLKGYWSCISAFSSKIIRHIRYMIKTFITYVLGVGKSAAIQKIFLTERSRTCIVLPLDLYKIAAISIKIIPKKYD